MFRPRLTQQIIYICVSRKTECACTGVEEGCWGAAEMVGNATDVSVGVVYTILTAKLERGIFSDRWVPRLLHPDQLRTRLMFSMGILSKRDQDREAFH